MFTAEAEDKLLQGDPDYVLDAIDDIETKVCACYQIIEGRLPNRVTSRHWKLIHHLGYLMQTPLIESRQIQPFLTRWAVLIILSPCALSHGACFDQASVYRSHCLPPVSDAAFL